MITSEWGTPNMVESGPSLELLTQGKYGHQIHVWDLRRTDAGFERSIAGGSLILEGDPAS